MVNKNWLLFVDLEMVLILVYHLKLVLVLAITLQLVLVSTSVNFRKRSNLVAPLAKYKQKSRVFINKIQNVVNYFVIEKYSSIMGKRD